MNATQYRIHNAMQSLTKDISKKDVGELVVPARCVRVPKKVNTRWATENIFHVIGVSGEDFNQAWDAMRASGRIVRTRSNRYVLRDSAQGRKRSMDGALKAA